MSNRFFPAAVALAFLSACGGSATSPNQITGFDALAGEANTMLGAAAPLLDANDYTPLASLPPSGNATYAGYVGMLINPPLGVNLTDAMQADLLGRVELEVQLASNRIEGSMFDFVLGEDSSAVPGVLELAAQLDRTVDVNNEYTITGSATGQVRNADDETYDVDLSLLLDHYGADRSVVAGFVDGSATGGTEVLVLEGRVLTSRQ